MSIFFLDMNTDVFRGEMTDNQGLFKHISAEEKKERQMKQMWKTFISV